MFDFKNFSNKMEEKKVDTIEDRTSENYVYRCLWDEIDLEDINLDKLSVATLTLVMEQLPETMTYEDEDGVIFLDPNSPGYIVSSLGHKIDAVEKSELVRVSSSYRFI